MNKYYKPRSLTFWSALVPIIAGVILAVAPAWPEVDILQRAVIVINEMTGGLHAAVLINGGLIALGIRSSIKD